MSPKPRVSTRTLDLDKPADARFFLRGATFQGRRITQIHLANGKVMELVELTDEQAVHYAKELYFDWMGGKEGVGGFVDLEPEIEH